MAELDNEAQEKYEMLTRRLQEVLGGDIIKQILVEGRTPKGYWGESWLLVCIKSISCTE
jgi:hypothetical protein